MEVDAIKGRGKGGSQPWRKAPVVGQRQQTPARPAPSGVPKTSAAGAKWMSDMRPCKWCGGKHLHAD
eukprot:10760115-Heterocapsa_arctica.AAC.1